MSKRLKRAKKENKENHTVQGWRIAYEQDVTQLLAELAQNKFLIEHGTAALLTAKDKRIAELKGALEKTENHICNYELDDCVVAFAKRMQYKLDKNKHKECEVMNPDGQGRGWDKCGLHWLIKRAKEEIKELEKELLPGASWEKATFESADVGNFMMMVHDILRKRIKRFNIAEQSLKESQ